MKHFESFFSWRGGVVLSATVCICLQASLYAQTLQQNLWVTNGEVNAIAYSESTNTIYIGGSFTNVGPHTDRGAALSVATGSADADFPKVNGIIRAVVSDGSGGWFIGGEFTFVGGRPRNRIAHIRPDKTVDPNWDPRNTNGIVYALAVHGSKLYVGGTFTQIGDSSRVRLAAMDLVTGVPTLWKPSANNAVRAIAVSGSRIYVGGAYTTIAGTARNALAALDTTGTLDSTWAPIVAAPGDVYDIKLSGRRVYICGSFTTINTNNTRNRLAAIDTSGALIDWNPSANGTVWSLAISGSTVYAGGEFTSISNNTNLKYIVAIDTGGTPRNWSSANNNGYVYAVAAAGSKVYAGGQFTNMGNLARSRIAVLDSSTGNAIQAWNPNANDVVRALAVSGLTLYAGGEFTTIGGITRNGIAAIDGSTGVPTTWNPDAGFGANTAVINALALSGTTLYVGGRFTTIGDSNRSRIAALNTTTGKATGWNPNVTTSNTNAAVYSLAVSGSIVYVGGDFVGSATIGGRQRTAIAAIHASTGNATAWNPSPNVSTVYTIAVSGPTVYVGGNFSSIGGLPRSRLAGLDATVDTLMATPWNPSPNGTVNSILLAGSIIFVGGGFDRIGTPQQDRGRIAALNSVTGEALATWQANIPVYTVQSLALAGSSLYVGGNFTNIGSQVRNRVAKLDANNGSVTTWNPDVSGSNLTYVNAIAVSRRNQKIYLGGNFEAISSETRSGLAGVNDIISSVKNLEGDYLPQRCILDQNYPNPFNPTTNIKFQITKSNHTTLKVYDLLGKEVATLVNEHLTPGSYETTFDGARLSSGVYFYRLQAGGFVQTKKLVLQK